MFKTTTPRYTLPQLLVLFLAYEPRVVTRWDVHKYARRAYDLGVRYIGGCCGFEPYHIRAIAEEVSYFLTEVPFCSYIRVA